MTKKRIENDLAWMEIKTLEPRIDCVYGFRDGTDVHGHTVLSGSEIIHQRDISGATLLISGANLMFSGANFILAT